MSGVRVLHVDEALIVVDKPSGLLAVPGRGEAGLVNLAAQVQAEFADALVVHRLDMGTSGLMLFARGLPAQRRLSLAFEQRRVSKEYVAVVEGLVAQDAGRIDLPLAADWPRRPHQKVCHEAGKPSLTHWRVLERVLERVVDRVEDRVEDSAAKSAEERADDRTVGTTRLALRPVTGRSHQLRVHLQAIGHPIRGDDLYAPEPLRAARLLLHACAVEVEHPANGERLSFRSEPAF